MKDAAKAPSGERGMESRQGVALRKSSVHSINTEKTDVCIYIYVYGTTQKSLQFFCFYWDLQCFNNILADIFEGINFEGCA